MKNSPIRALTLAMSCLGLLATSVASQANEGGLYGPTAPAGSTFVRTYNAGSSELDLSLGPVSIKDVAPQGSSDFKFLPAGTGSCGHLEPVQGVLEEPRQGGRIMVDP